MKIIRSQDCGNSPKNALLADFEVALVSKNIVFLTEHTFSDLSWSIAGFQQGEGLTALLDALDSRSANSPFEELEIASSFSHGKMGAVTGVCRSADSKEFEFCTMYELNSAGSEKVKSIKIFLIEKIRPE